MKKRQEEIEEEINYRDTLEYPYHLVKRENPDEFMYINPDGPQAGRIARNSIKRDRPHDCP